MAETTVKSPTVPRIFHKRYLRIDEVAQYLGISRRTVYRLIEEEKLEAVKIRSCSRVRWEDLQRFEAYLNHAKESV